MKLAVACLCYNQSSSPYLPEFLESLEIALASAAAACLVLAGDNSDVEPFINREIIAHHNLNSAFPARLIAFEKNLGFAAAYNRLIKMAEAEGCDYFLMLNPDMIVEPTAITKLIEAICMKSELAAVCPKIYRWDFKGGKKTKIIDSCGIMMKPGLRFYDLGQGESDSGCYDNTKVFGPSGAAALFRLSALDAIIENGQYFDERFFMYKEDCDLAYRLNKAGLKTLFVPQAIMYHDRSAASQGSILATLHNWRQRSRQTRIWSFVNQHLIFAKHLTNEGLYSHFIVYARIVFYFIFSLILAPFLLKSYPLIRRHYSDID